MSMAQCKTCTKYVCICPKTKQEKLDALGRELIVRRREKQFRSANLRQAQMQYDDAEEMLELAIMNYNQVMYDTGSESKEENQKATG